MGSTTSADVYQSDEDIRQVALALMSREVHDLRAGAGWLQEEKTFGDYVALLHSEVAEILEAFRDHGVARAYQDDKPVDVGSEMADVLIRLIGFADICGINLVEEFDRKMAYNRTRGPSWRRRTVVREWTPTNYEDRHLRDTGGI